VPHAIVIVRSRRGCWSHGCGGENDNGLALGRSDGLLSIRDIGRHGNTRSLALALFTG
jgi:hypothetical protein